MPQPVQPSAPALNFMLANWYSGATLLALVISRHSQVECNGETFPFGPRDTSRYDCTCGQYLDECEFYRTACSHMWSGDVNGWDHSVFCQVPALSRNSLLDRLLKSVETVPTMIRPVARWSRSNRGRQRAFVDAHVQFYDQAVEYSGRSVYVDGTKSIRRAQLFLENTPRRLRIVHLIRDGRAFANSFRKNRHMDMTALPQAANQWNEYIHHVDQFQRRSGRVEVLTLRYEDLCRKPEEFLNELFTFLGVPYEDVLSAPRSDAHVLGNRMRREFTNVIREDESWKQEIDDAGHESLNQMMHEGLTRFGYL